MFLLRCRPAAGSSELRSWGGAAHQPGSYSIHSRCWIVIATQNVNPVIISGDSSVILIPEQPKDDATKKTKFPITMSKPGPSLHFVTERTMISTIK